MDNEKTIIANLIKEKMEEMNILIKEAKGLGLQTQITYAFDQPGVVGKLRDKEGFAASITEKIVY